MPDWWSDFNNVQQWVMILGPCGLIILVFLRAWQKQQELVLRRGQLALDREDRSSSQALSHQNSEHGAMLGVLQRMMDHVLRGDGNGSVGLQQLGERMTNVEQAVIAQRGDMAALKEELSYIRAHIEALPCHDVCAHMAEGASEG